MTDDDSVWTVAVEWFYDRGGKMRADTSRTAWLGGMVCGMYGAQIVDTKTRHDTADQVGTPDVLRGVRPPAWAGWSAVPLGGRDHEVAAFHVAYAAGGDRGLVIGVDPGVGYSRGSGTGVCAVDHGRPVLAATLRADEADGSDVEQMIRLFQRVAEVVDHVIDRVPVGAS